MKKEIAFRLNGEKRSLIVEPNDILLDVLREKLGVKSPKRGCDRGDCGTCTIFLNGKSVRSCLIFAVEVNGQEITTIEGLSEEKLTTLQEAFIDHLSFQCGFCAPGIVISATELLRRVPHPTKEEIKDAISGNLCRCTGYVSIIEAIHDASGKTGG
jgi:carbon-monoxide dehydrogenase small subunit